MDYKEIRKIRELMLDEVRNNVATLTTEHLVLVEMRVQTVILAKLTSTDVEKEASDWKRKK